MNRGMMKAGIYLALIVVAGFLAIGVLAQSVLPLYPITASITVKDSNTGQGVSGAQVSCYAFGMLIGSGVTNTYGVATLSASSSYTCQFIVVASGYQTKSQDLLLTASGQATIYITPSSSTPTYVTVRVYTVTSEGYPVRDVKITGGASQVSTNQDAYADVLCVSGPLSLTFDGSLASMRRQWYWEPMTFSSFTRSLTASSDAVYTVIVPEGTVTTGRPIINNDNSELWDFLFASAIPGVPNWALLAVLAFLLLRR